MALENASVKAVKLEELRTRLGNEYSCVQPWDEKTFASRDASVGA